MNTKENLYETIIEIKKLLSKKEISALELTKSSLERIEETNNKTNAFLYIAENEALEDAKKIDKKLADGENIGPLGGIPTSIKDLEAVKGMPLTNGSLFYKDNIADFDQLGIERIKNAGGIILGKTNTPEFGLCATTDNRLGDDCRNPWDLNCTSGGSSGGAGAAIASGVHPIGQGSDGGGSVRIPSGLCGIYGIKGTQGRIPRYHSGLQSWNPINFSCIGPMSWYVKDSAIMLQVMSGPHPKAESTAIQTTPPDFLKDIENGISGKKIGWSVDLGSINVDPEVKSVTQDAVKIFEDLGASIEPFEFKYNIRELGETIGPILGALGYNKNGPLLEENPEKLMNYTRKLLEIVKNWEGPVYMNSISELYKFRNYMESLFEQYDFLATPTMAVPAHECGNPPQKVDGVEQFDFGFRSMWPSYGENDNPSHKNGAGLLAQFTAIFNWSGNPAATLPCGFSSKGLPISLQIAGAKEDEVGVLQASRAFEIAKPWHDKKPIL